MFFQGFFKIYVFMYGLYPRVGCDGGMFHDKKTAVQSEEYHE